MTGIITHSQKTMLKPAAFEIVLEFLTDVTRQCPALCSTVYIKSRIPGFDKLIKKRLLWRWRLYTVAPTPGLASLPAGNIMIASLRVTIVCQSSRYLNEEPGEQAERRNFCVLVLVVQRQLRPKTDWLLNNDSAMVTFISSNYILTSISHPNRRYTIKRPMNSRSHDVFYPGKPGRVKWEKPGQRTLFSDAYPFKEIR